MYSKVTDRKFLSEIIHTTYNGGSNAREESLLLKLDSELIRREIRAFRTDLQDFEAWKVSFAGDARTDFHMVVRRFLTSSADLSFVHLAVGKTLGHFLDPMSSSNQSSPHPAVPQTRLFVEQQPPQQPPATKLPAEQDDDVEFGFGQDFGEDDSLLTKSLPRVSEGAIDAMTWSMDAVGQYLSEQGYDDRTQRIFMERNIEGQDFLEMTADDLAAASIREDSVVERLLADIKSLRSSSRTIQAQLLDPPCYGCDLWNLLHWSAKDVGMWLNLSGREAFMSVFEDAEIDGRALLALDMETLVELSQGDVDFADLLAVDLQKLQKLVRRSAPVSEPAAAHDSVANIPPAVRLASEVARDISLNWRRMPFGLCFLVKEMRSALCARFPKSPLADIEKYLCELLCSSYISPVIRAPEQFEVLPAALAGRVNSSHRIVFQVASELILHCAKGHVIVPSSGSDESKCYTRFFTQAIPQLRGFIESVCKVSSLEEYFGLDEYTDVANLSAPVIYIAPADLVEMHGLLVAHIQSVAPAPNDVLREVLGDFSRASGAPASGFVVPTLEQLGVAAEKARVPTSLQLRHKFAVDEDSKTDDRALLLRTMRMVVDLVRQMKGRESLRDVLFGEIRPDEEVGHRRFEQAATQVVPVEHQGRSRAVSIAGASLKRIQVMARANTKALCSKGLVSEQDGYQALLSAIALEIRNQSLHRKHRRQEIQKLSETRENLKNKEQYLKERQYYYQQYLDACVAKAQMPVKARKSGFFASLTRSGSTRSASKSSLGLPANSASSAASSTTATPPMSPPSAPLVVHKWTGARLKQKELLVGMCANATTAMITPVGALRDADLKKCLFELSSNQVGVYKLCVVYSDGSSERAEFSMDALMQRQYEGAEGIRIVPRCELSVARLLHTIHKKFGGKK